MSGDERVRYCAQCQLQVYNLSEMTEAEATKLVQSREGRLCVRFYRRPDGTMLTQDCPVGLAALRRRAVRACGAAVAVALFLVANVAGAIGAYRALGWIPGGKLLQRNDNALAPSVARNALRQRLGLPREEPISVLMGDVCLPPPPIGANPISSSPPTE